MTADPRSGDAQSTTYCLGFLFTNDRKNVVLVEKARPEWQRGKLNGAGGHVEVGERPSEAMSREACEELNTDANLQWLPFAVMDGPDWIVYCYRAFSTPNAEWADGAGDDEPVGLYEIDQIDAVPCLPNLSWLIPLALDKNVRSTTIINHGGNRYPLDLIARDSMPAAEYFALIRDISTTRPSA